MAWPEITDSTKNLLIRRAKHWQNGTIENSETPRTESPSRVFSCPRGDYHDARIVIVSNDKRGRRAVAPSD